MIRKEMSDYINEPQRQEESNKEGTNQTERRYWLLFLGFGVLCVVQACLNISLRLAFYVKEPALLDCNATQTGGTNPVVQMRCEEDALVKCHKIQDKSNFLTAFCELLEDRNVLKNKINALKNETKTLKTQLKELSNCVVSEQCPPGWKAINSRCYFFSSETRTWDDSRAYCQSQRSDLVVINDLREQSDIYRLDNDRFLLFWIGLRGTKGTFKWVDGSPLNKSWGLNNYYKITI
ncbi:C-type lectin domain family 4 member M-like isoform X2 [Gouania willdenowi]|uniref:C-type lectin domain family 4 member M-like isoform X2 n=1 Tax=Gouania willdenowi TaxID=441366 RepID=UPI001055C972|nr:C-type lectin domain family 4 member M-like isoform X2 [Gouania willdenowi]